MVSTRISCVMLEDAAMSCESAVDIVDARIPEMNIPATNEGIKPKPLIYLEISTIMVSASEFEA